MTFLSSLILSGIIWSGYLFFAIRVIPFILDFLNMGANGGAS